MRDILDRCRIGLLERNLFVKQVWILLVTDVIIHLMQILENYLELCQRLRQCYDALANFL